MRVGIFAVMIQLGSRSRRRRGIYQIDIPRGPVRPHLSRRGRRFAVRFIVAVLRRRSWRGAFLADFVKTRVLLRKLIEVIAAAFVLGGVAMLARLSGCAAEPDGDQAPCEDADSPAGPGIGACQTLALVPGVSRSGATIIGALLRSASAVGRRLSSRSFSPIPDHDRGVRARFYEFRSQLSPSGAGDHRRFRPGPLCRGGGRPPLPDLHRPLGFDAVCVVSHRRRCRARAALGAGVV